MNKQIVFTFEGREYTLEFTRDTVRQMERGGFVAEDLAKKPMSVLPELFAGAFIRHHPTARRDRIEKIFDSMANKTALIDALSDMYNDTLLTLVEEPEEGKNVEWTPNWETANG